MANLDVIIIGAGIGGLTTAIALKRRGVTVRVFEAAPELSEVGAGIWVPPNAMQVLTTLGIATEIRDAGYAVEQARIEDSQRGPLQTVATRTAAGGPTIAIVRTRLQQILASHVAGSVVTGHRCTAVRISGTRACATFGNGDSIDADVVIGADGLRSAVRQSIFPQIKLRYSGQTSWRCVTPFVLPSRLDGVSLEVWAPGRRFGLSGIGNGLVYWYATADAPAGETEAVESRRERLTGLAQDFPEPVPQLIASIDPQRVLRTDIWDFEPMQPWHKGPVALIGDAAHGTTPNLGQGGAQAIEDAGAIAHHLTSAANVEQALTAFEAARMKKAHMIANRAFNIGRMAHMKSPVGRLLRNTVLRLAPQSMIESQTQQIYAVTE